MKTLEHKDTCNICDSEYDEDAGGIKGYFGILPVTFCEWCASSIHDMVYQEVKEEVIDQFKEWQRLNPEPCGMSRK